MQATGTACYKQNLTLCCILLIKEDRFICYTQNICVDFISGIETFMSFCSNIIYVCCFLTNGSKKIIQT